MKAIKPRIASKLFSSFAVAATIVALSANPGSATTPLVTGSNCVDFALTLNSSSWVCTPEMLQFIAADGTVSEITLQASEFNTAPPRLKVDDYNSWCEFAGAAICHRLVNAYIEETKGNAYWGNQSSTLGTIDIILRTNLNGASPTYTLTMIKDAGATAEISPSVVTHQNSPQVRDFKAEIWGLYTISGRVNFPIAYSTPITYSGKYQAKVSGMGLAPGVPSFALATLWTSTWTCSFTATAPCNF